MLNKGVLEGIEDSVKEYIQDNLIEVLEEVIPSEYQVYSDRQEGTAVVINVKNWGMPNTDAVASALSKKTGKDEDAIEGWLESNLYDLWTEDVGFFFENLDYDNLAVRGRSAGYWGFDLDAFDSNSFDIDIQKLSKSVEKEIIDEYLSGDYDRYETEADLDWDVGNDYIYDHSENLIPYISLNKKAEKDLMNFYKEVKGEAKYWEKPDRWVETIISNGYLDDLPDAE